jgi:hypothetical protein
MSIAKGSKYAAYPIIGYLNGVPVRKVPDELVFQEDEALPVRQQPPFEGLTGNAALLADIGRELEAQGLGRLVEIATSPSPRRSDPLRRQSRGQKQTVKRSQGRKPKAG